MIKKNPNRGNKGNAEWQQLSILSRKNPFKVCDVVVARFCPIDCMAHYGSAPPIRTQDVLTIEAMRGVPSGGTYYLKFRGLPGWFEAGYFVEAAEAQKQELF